MRRKSLTAKRAIWLGLLGTPAVLVAAIAVLGVTAGSAGPQDSAATALPAGATQQGDLVIQETALGSGVQTLAQLRNYWTPERMANAQPMTLPGPDVSTAATPHGSLERFPPSTERRMAVQLSDGSTRTEELAGPSSVETFTEPFHNQVQFMRWDWFGKYRPIIPGDLQNSENRAISTVHKMFFTAAGGGNFVCSSSTLAQDAAWTAGHCVADPTIGFSTNVLFCPSYDSAQGGVNPNVGCWGAESLVTSTGWFNDENLALDYGAADVSDTGVIAPASGLIGNTTGWNGIIYADTTAFGAFNDAWMSLGYPAAPPFNGGKINVCSSGFGYVDDEDANAGNGTSISIGCDMTGGSSGGPWHLWFGKPGQVGGAPLGGICCNLVGGHNSWGHVGGGAPAEMNSPFYNCLAIAIWVTASDSSPITCPSP